jgi:serine phosphatase RsbU (regulator of sigma subunit)
VNPEQGFVLVVDDNEANRDVLSRRLKRQGHTVAVAENGLQALEMMHTQSFDLILLDIMMPEMNGYQVLEELKANKALRHIPVIMISALDDIDSVVRCIELGAEDYLYKPFNPVLLKARVSASLEKKWLRDQEQAYVQAVKRELELGRRIQADFLPGSLPKLDGWEIAAVFHPAREVAGDFYDVFMLPANHVGLVIADVCDKGVGAALFMALVRSLIRAFSEQVATDATDALEAVSMTNNYIARNHHNNQSRHMFATLFFGVLNPTTGKLTYVNGGHDAPILTCADGIKTFLNVTGPAVGFAADTTFNQAETIMEPGDILLSFTDGVTEARSIDGSLFTEERLIDLLQTPVTTARGLMEQISAEVSHHIADNTPSDDITMLAVQRLAR